VVHEIQIFICSIKWCYFDL